MKLDHYETLVIIFVVNIMSTKATQIQETIFKVLHNKRSQLTVTDTYFARSEIECSRICTEQQDCSAMNFNGSICKLLETGSDYNADVIDDEDWTFICKYM